MDFKITWFGSIIPDFNLMCIESVRRSAESSGHSFELIHDKNYSGSVIHASVLKDNLFLDMACENPHLAFIDADIELFGIPEYLTPGKPYFEICYNNPHIGYVIVNGCCDWFKDILKEKKDKEIKNTRGYTNKLLRGRLHDVGEIPHNTFKHYMVETNNIKNYDKSKGIN